ncbi:glutamate cyclase domain-containing protein [Nocardioides ferulae]|uniref:glutamate cyclase domain-containing protein n=1 Tax=Nocardioides ferulae TaxID=2340821 RepID=UPI000EB38DF5|nr:glutamate cyclase domain-containing protein [Nocardioides ferulae]
MTDAGTLQRVAMLAATDTGRGSSRLAVPVLGDLGAAAGSLLEHRGSRVGIITGFYISRARPPAAETDGPLGVAVLAQTLSLLGSAVDVVTDPPCLRVVDAALGAVGNPELRARVWTGGEAPSWSHAVSVERVGRAVDGTYRNMLGVDISEVTAPLDTLYESLDAAKVAVGDGGNEIGMGRLDSELVASVVDQGATIRSIVTCDHLIVGGTSNWGAFALAAVLAVQTGVDPTILSAMTSRRILDAMVAAGGVDGVSARSEPTVDGLSWDQYWAVPERILDLLSQAS